jgi:hypothetical protein
MKTQEKSHRGKQRCFDPELIAVVAAQGFTLNRKPRVKTLCWTDWNRQPWSAGCQSK